MATFTLAVNSVCLESRRLVLLLILMSFISDGTCQAISLQCPSLQENVLTKFNCVFNTSTCNYTSVFFDFESKDGNRSSLCKTPSSPCGQQPVGVMNCSCVTSTSSYSNYQLNFLGDKATYDQGNLTCAVNCRTGPVANSCQPIFDVTTSYFPATTASSNSSSTDVGNAAGNQKGRMHVLRAGILAPMSGIIVLISVYLN